LTIDCLISGKVFLKGDKVSIFVHPIKESEVKKKEKKGMRRPDPSEPHGTESNKKNKHPKNDMPPVPEIQGKAKHGHVKAGRV